MLLWKVRELLGERGVPVKEHRSWLTIDVEHAQITVEPRPLYCDRGNFIVKVTPRGPFALALDEQDGFPRYYFGPLACADEIVAWMAARRILPDRLADAPRSEASA